MAANQRMKPVAFFLSLSLSLVLLNFAFDILRRFHFEQTKDKVESDLDVALADASHLFERTLALMNEIESSREVASDSAKQIQVGLSLLLDELDVLYRLREDLIGNSPAAGGTSIDSIDSLADQSCLQKALDASIPELRNLIQAAQEDPARRERYLAARKPADWDPTEILADFERRYRQRLSAHQRQIISKRIETYRQAAQLTFSDYRMRLSTSMVERLETGDYDRLQGDGTFTAPAQPRGDLLALSLTGNYRLIWEKDEYPDLHRLELVREYLPIAMLEDVDGFFQNTKERSSQ